MTTTTKRLGATTLILLTSLLMYLLSSQKLPFIDSQANDYFKKTVTEATLAYATTRGLNAVVSVLKESELAISPAGIGLTIAVGQILDPIDDMTERLSSVLVASIVSLGLQKIINDVGGAISFQLMSLLFPLLIIPVWFRNRTTLLVTSLIAKIITLALILRILLPLSSLANNAMYEQVFMLQITEARDKLSIISSQYKDLSSFDQQQQGGIIANFTKSTNSKVVKTKEIFSNIISNAESIITSLVKLTVLYVTLFVTQVVLIPIFMLWLLLKAIDTILPAGLPGHLLHPTNDSQGQTSAQLDCPKPQQQTGY